MLYRSDYSFRRIYPLLLLVGFLLKGQVSWCQEEMWDKTAEGADSLKIQWFKDAKFGLFIHWGLYSQLGGVWKDKRYYGSGEWIMSQAKIPAGEYAAVAASFNPVNFNAAAWADLAREAGVRYLVITAKHHEGFAMYDTKVSDFNIVQSTPYKHDPMKDLAGAIRKNGIRFGFYYSQFLDWHEPNGGGNKWDFDETKKDYLRYYKEKSIPQLKELLTNYGPLGIVWFDMPGGLTKEQTRQLVDSLRILQPGSLFSSRVGQGLGDYRDYGDSEIPPAPIAGAWESIYTQNDTWGYIAHDMDFKSAREIIQLLARVASRGGNLMLNVGPDGKGNIPEYSAKYLRQTGAWLRQNGESIYGTTYGFIPEQPWGVTTCKPGKLFLQVFHRPLNGRLMVPGLTAQVSKVYTLAGRKPVKWTRSGNDLFVYLPFNSSSIHPGTSMALNASMASVDASMVYVVEYSGKQPDYHQDLPVTISPQYEVGRVEAVQARVTGKVRMTTLTHSYYYGDWKHTTCLTGMRDPQDTAVFSIRITEPGDYKMSLEYSCPGQNSRQDAVLQLNEKEYFFQTLPTGEYNSHQPLLFIRQTVAVTSVQTPGIFRMALHPVRHGNDLFALKGIMIEPIK